MAEEGRHDYLRGMMRTWIIPCWAHGAHGVCPRAADASCDAGVPVATPAAPEAKADACSPMPESEGPTRRAFFHEVLFADATRRTPLFDDYTRGSYHVDKLDLASGLAAEAECAGVHLRGLVVLGRRECSGSSPVVARFHREETVRVHTCRWPAADRPCRVIEHGRRAPCWSQR